MNNESECFTGISKHEKTMYEKTRARSASVFIHCFRVFGYPGETRARMNRDVKPAAHESNLLS